MAMKVTIDDLFDKEEGDLQAALDRLRVWEQRLDWMLGMAVMWVILVPEVFDRSFDLSYAPLVWLAMVGAPPILGFYLLLRPSWRRVPIAARRSAIVQSFAISLLTFGSLSLIFGVSATGGYPAILALLSSGGVAYGLHRVNARWQESDAGELFP